MSFYDILGISRIFVEFFQYIGLMPSLPVILNLLKLIGNSCSLNLENIFLLNSEVYSIKIMLILASTGAVLFARILLVFRIEVPFLRIFMIVSGDILFISTLSTLLNIYLCQQSSVNPFLYYDCYTNC